MSGATVVEQLPKVSPCSVNGYDVTLPLADILDLDAEAARLKKILVG